jgi:hypothetical protein
MKELVYIRMVSIDRKAGINYSFWLESQLEEIKKLPEQYAKSNCLPDSIELRRFVFDLDENLPIELSIIQALNRECVKFPRVFAKWTLLTGWVEL